MDFEGKPSTGSGLSAAMHALAQHNDNASNVAFIGRLRELTFGSTYPKFNFNPGSGHWVTPSRPVPDSVM
jgi:hypothetical protein